MTSALNASNCVAIFNLTQSTVTDHRDKIKGSFPCNEDDMIVNLEECRIERLVAAANEDDA